MFIPKKIAVIVGHSLLKNGNVTSADGRGFGGVIEYDWCKKFSPILVETFKENGCQADLIICPEKSFTSAKEEKTYKLNLVNNKGYDLIIENHLNAFDGKARGTETLYSEGSNLGKEVATRVNNKLKDIYPNRGVKARNDLYILTKTKPTSILNEYFFCDNTEDCNLSNDINKMKVIAIKVVEAVLNKNINITNSPNPNNKPVYANGDYNRKAKLIENLKFRVGRGTKHTEIKTLPKGTTITVNYCKDNWFSTYDVTYYEEGKEKPTFCCGEYIELI